MSESGHSQPGMYGQGRRRRRRRDRDPGPPGQNLSGPSRDRDYVPRERRDGSEEPSGPLLQKTPIILAKPPGERISSKPSAPASGAPSLEKPIMLIKTRDEGGKPGNTPDVPPSASGAGTVKLEREAVIGQTKLLPPEKMKHSIKLVDDQMNWCDSAMEYLRDQTDMLVVGVIGLQGTGKSTIMSLLSANSPEEDQRAYVFRAQTQEIKERAGNQSSGIDFYITQERVIFLDTQPILSPSILDHLINNDRKLPPEYNLPHTYVEMQSLQITAFLFTVCHVVIVVQDWFTDINLYRFLQTAEMLKPSTPSASHDSTGSSGADDGSEYYPHIVFLQNKARREEFCPRNLKKMHMAVDKLMAHSHLKYKGTLSMLDCNIFPGLNRDYLETEVNLFLLPMMENDGEDALTRAGSGPPLFSLLPGYRGHPSFSSLVSKFRSQILAMSRSQLSHTILTEKNWFHYAARIWDGVKKSSALSEYSRLLS
ncbi:nonsense-mediated mRNA decay factor SMG9 isoform X2 [Pseudorasbora parva]|uniref:nonsense-mediated mRNA decay factor SMG9 isoform X2 n=1 Tax=Pseudorasbora parva TaxID=51549 RepID=UPI00351EF873